MRWEESGAICSYSEYIDELEDEIAEKDKQLQDAKVLLREMQGILDNSCNLMVDVFMETPTPKKSLKICWERYLDFKDQNADKIKSLLGEE